MSKSDRNNPKLAGGSESKYTFYDFDRDFPDDAACLSWLVGHLYPEGIYCPKCEKVTKHHRVTKRTCYACQYCGHQEYPLAGTIFQDSATSLRLWFHGFFLMAQTRCGISAKQLERELGVTYKTAWRMFNKIRSLLAPDDGEKFEGTVEADEAYFGGRDYWKKRSAKKAGTGRRNEGKTPVLGMAERGTDERSGRVSATVVPNVSKASLSPHITGKIKDGSVLYTDDWRTYPNVYWPHDWVSHSTEVYVSGDVHTNTIEGFWSLVKREIVGVYHGVRDKYLQNYLDEYTFRYNNRNASGRGMFDAFLSRIEKVPS